MNILTILLAEVAKVTITQIIILLFGIISTKKRKKKTTRRETNKTGKSSIRKR